MSETNIGNSDWQPPIPVVRIKLSSEEHLRIEWVTRARSALDASGCSGLTRLAEVEQAPDLLLLAGSAEWAAQVLLRSRRAGDLTPIVVLNATPEGGANARILDAGADDCLSCPFDAAELRARLEAVMRRLGPSFWRCSEIAADRATLSIRVRDVAARVSRRQFEIFLCLAERRERWVHSDEIIATVSGTHHHSTTSLVRVQMCAIRKALGVARTCIRCDGRRSYMLTLDHACARTIEERTERAWA